MPTNDWIVWLTRIGAEVVLGHPVAEDSAHRFRVVGRFLEHAAAGVLIDVEAVQKLTVPRQSIVGSWTVSPRSCLIPLHYIESMERIEEVRASDDPESRIG